ncbi:MAG TPA: nucleoside-diphosphate sugar epimerase/dehydratase [Stellaceae bacterium]|jgi:O-antigen biosynthesis protein WbqV|nr:nucleoside-diphosphate sugar epimerase/dehydratase [Stellaceae bacterium]
MMRFRYRHGQVAYAHDIVMAALSFIVSLYLRVGGGITAYTEVLTYGTALMAVIAAVVFWSLRLYRGIWRYASASDLLALTRAATLVIVIFVPALFVLTRAEALPRSVPIINWFVLIFMIGAPRFIYRIAKDRRFGLLQPNYDPQSIPVLLAGAGDGAELFIRAAHRSKLQLYRAVAMVSEGEGRVGRNIHGIEVLGTFDQIPEVVAELERAGQRPQRLVLTRDDIDGATIRKLVDTADVLGMSVARLPRLVELRDGAAEQIDIRPVAIEDLLGRPQTVLDRDAMRRLIAGRRILVTGAGGTIGSELVAQICGLAPAHITLLDSGEFNLYRVDLEVADAHPGLPRRAVLADVRDRIRLERVMREMRPELVFHAAALKHVPMVELNPFEGVLTNVVGTRNVADACRAAGVAAMVQISTDKAVNPTSVMGASKRIAESYCQALDIGERRAHAGRDAGREGGGAGHTRFVTVRFGNVLGSTGSVVPLFQRQLAAGGPLTVTHEEVMRYFMTVREAVELVLQATVLGSTGEAAGKLFVLDMGEPVRIIDLARQMIRLAGKRPTIDIAIKISGLRPGEKLFEEIFHGAEPLLPTACKGILLAAPRTGDAAALGTAIDELTAICARGDLAALRGQLRRLVPEYQASAETAGNVIKLARPGVRS